jgi:hypothetical protein
VAFRVRPDRGILICHCSQCRSQSGHAWAAAAAPRAELEMTADATLAWVAASPAARRGFCRVCGAFLFWERAAGGRISFAAGAIDGPTGLAVEGVWHAQDAGDYACPHGGPPPAVTPLPTGGLQGGCLCGANRFTLPGPMGEVTACHCTQCRKTSGHFSASFDVAEGALAWSARREATFRTPGGSTRAFCPACGGKLWFRAADGALSVECGAIAQPTAGQSTGGRMVAHIHTATAADYVRFADGLPRHPAA